MCSQTPRPPPEDGTRSHRHLLSTSGRTKTARISAMCLHPAPDPPPPGYLVQQCPVVAEALTTQLRKIVRAALSFELFASNSRCWYTICSALYVPTSLIYARVSKSKISPHRRWRVDRWAWRSQPVSALLIDLTSMGILMMRCPTYSDSCQIRMWP